MFMSPRDNGSGVWLVGGYAHACSDSSVSRRMEQGAGYNVGSLMMWLRLLVQV